MEITLGSSRNAINMEEMYDLTKVDSWIFSAWDWRCAKSSRVIIGEEIGERIVVGEGMNS